MALQPLRSFGQDDNSCGYCGYNPQEHTEHYCDGFGHSVNVKNMVYGDACIRCKNHRYCEQASALVEMAPKRWGGYPGGIIDHH